MISWHGFHGTDKELERWMSALKKASLLWCRKFKAPELADEFEGRALDLFVERSAVGGEITYEIAHEIGRLIGIFDEKTVTDGELTARMIQNSERVTEGSFIESQIVSPESEARESAMAQILDGERLDEGRDLSEVVEDILSEEDTLSAAEETVLSLTYLWGYTVSEIGRFMGHSPGWASQFRRRTVKRQKLSAEYRAGLQRLREDPNLTVLEIKWLTI